MASRCSRGQPVDLGADLLGRDDRHRQLPDVGYRYAGCRVACRAPSPRFLSTYDVDRRAGARASRGTCAGGRATVRRLRAAPRSTGRLPGSRPRRRGDHRSPEPRARTRTSRTGRRDRTAPTDPGRRGGHAPPSPTLRSHHRPSASHSSAVVRRRTCLGSHCYAATSSGPRSRCCSPPPTGPPPCAWG